jgi:hypothetical protein
MGMASGSKYGSKYRILTPQGDVLGPEFSPVRRGADDIGTARKLARAVLMCEPLLVLPAVDIVDRLGEVVETLYWGKPYDAHRSYS